MNTSNSPFDFLNIPLDSTFDASNVNMDDLMGGGAAQGSGNGNGFFDYLDLEMCDPSTSQNLNVDQQGKQALSASPAALSTSDWDAINSGAQSNSNSSPYSRSVSTPGAGGSEAYVDTEMPLSPGYGVQFGGEAKNSLNMPLNDEVVVKQEEASPPTAPSALPANYANFANYTNFTTIPSNSNSNNRQSNDAVNQLGLTPQQQQDLLRQLLITLSQNGGAEGLIGNQGQPQGIDPAAVMGHPTEASQSTPSSMFTPSNNSATSPDLQTDSSSSRRVSNISDSEELREMSPTPPMLSPATPEASGLPDVSVQIARNSSSEPSERRASPSKVEFKKPAKPAAATVKTEAITSIPLTGDDLLSAPLPPLPALFGGQKGKGGKKGGGMSSVVLNGDEDVGEDDIWRPTPEEYKRLSSKEKRQLRNKLSARAFRNRRKDYIGELEDHIKDRDRLIEAIRTELKSARGERDELRQEINALKKAALVPTPESLQFPQPSASTPKPASAATSNSSSSTSPFGNSASRANAKAAPSPLNIFNPNKDLPSSASLLGLGSMSPSSLKGFWGGAAGGAGSYTSVHTALTPDLTLPGSFANKLASTSAPQQMNINPRLNNIPARPAQVPSFGEKGDGSDLSEGFDSWVEGTNFSHKSLDSYRMQLWTRMARDNALAKAGVPIEQRPKFLREPMEGTVAKSSSTSSANASTGSTLAAITQAYAQPSSASSSTGGSMSAVQSGVAAQVVQQAISTRMLSAFVAAFQNSTKDGLDGEKVSAVFSGRSKIAVVPDLSHNEKTPATETESALEQSFANLKLAAEKTEDVPAPSSPSKTSACLPNTTSASEVAPATTTASSSSCRDVSASTPSCQQYYSYTFFGHTHPHQTTPKSSGCKDQACALALSAGAVFNSVHRTRNVPSAVRLSCRE